MARWQSAAVREDSSHNPDNTQTSNLDRGQRDLVRTAGRGGAAVAIAKLYFILLGLVQQLILPRPGVLGTNGYGAWATVSSLAAIAYNPVVNASIQGASRTVAQAEPEQQPFAIRQLLKIHTVAALAIAGLFFLLAAPIARQIHAPHLTTSLRLLAGVIVSYGIYAPLVGVLNGSRRFLWQAGLDMSFATFRTIALIVGARAFTQHGWRSVDGASAGFVVVALSIAVVALGLVGIGRSGTPTLSVKKYLAFAAPVLLGQGLLNLLQQSDLLLLRYFSAQAAASIGRSPEAADVFVGAYRATQLFSFLPYQLLLSVTFILFPLLAHAHQQGDRASVASFVRTGVRIALIVAGAMVAVTSGLAGPLLRLVFRSNPMIEQLATESMQLLTLGFGAFALFGIFTTVLTSLSRERDSALLTGLAVLLVWAFGTLRLSQHAGFDRELLWLTAAATTLGLVLATLTAGWMVFRTTGDLVHGWTVLRVGFALGSAILLGRVLSPTHVVTTFASIAAVGVTYFAVLLLSRELGRADLARLALVVGRRR